MRKTAIFLSLLLTAASAQAAVTVGTVPTSLVASATTLAASTQLPVFEFALTADASETLSSVAVTVTSATAVSGDFASASVYKDDGDGAFDSGDMLAGSNSTVNVGSTTTVTTASNNVLSGAKFFVVLQTTGTWSGTDSVTVTLGANGITTSANSPTTSAVTTAAITVADTTAPALQTVVATNKVGGTAAVEAGDMVVLTFNEATNKPVIDASNINTILVLNNSHSWLDGASAIGSATWNSVGTVLTVTLSAGTTVPTIAVGDTVTITGTVIKDAANNNAAGSVAITGSFAPTTTGGDEDNDEDFGKVCAGGIINGRLYKGPEGETVYLAAACRLKPFRGAAVFHARGHKFQDIITLSSLTGITVSDQPALPAAGTLVQGSDKTVWFVSNKGTKKGFVSETAFKRLGFSFNSVKKISDTDLATMSTDTTVTENSDHPDGSIIKCGNSSTVFEVKNNSRFPFTNADGFLNRGHGWDVIATVDCGRFSYLQGSNLQ